METPRCPRCRKRLAYFYIARFLNPWKCRCPHCNAALEASGAWNWVYCLGLAFVGAVAGMAAYRDTVQLAFWGVLILVPLMRASWPLTRFKLKS